MNGPTKLGIYRHMQRLGSLLKLEGGAKMPKDMSIREVQTTLDIGQGGYMEREVESGGDWGGGDNIGGANEAVRILISPVTSAGPDIDSSDGKDRRVLAASVGIKMTVAAPAIPVLYGCEYYLKPDPDGTLEIQVLNAMYAYMPTTSFVTMPIFPLTGWMHSAGAVTSGGDPDTVFGDGATGIASTWDKVVPYGWSFNVRLRCWSSAGPANFDAGNSILHSVGAMKVPQGIRIPW